MEKELKRDTSFTSYDLEKEGSDIIVKMTDYVDINPDPLSECGKKRVAIVSIDEKEVDYRTTEIIISIVNKLLRDMVKLRKKIV